MKLLPVLLIPAFAIFCATPAQAQTVKRDIPYVEPAGADKLQTLDIYAPANAKNLPVVVWIHGGGWQTGDKASVQVKPQAFQDHGFVFVSVNYRLLPAVDMGTIINVAWGNPSSFRSIPRRGLSR